MASIGEAGGTAPSGSVREHPADFLVGLQARQTEHGSELALRFKTEPEDFEVVELNDDGSSVPFGSTPLSLHELETARADAAAGADANTADAKPTAPTGPDDWEKLRMRDPDQAVAHLEAALGPRAAGALARQAGALSGGDVVQEQLPDSAKQGIARWLDGSSPVGGVPAAVEAPSEKAPRTLVYLACACLFPHADVHASRRGEEPGRDAAAAPPGTGEWVVALREDDTARALRQALDPVDWVPVLRLLRLESRLPPAERAGYRLKGAYPDKQRRREVHQALAAAHRGLTTSSAHGSICIKWRPARGGKGNRKRRRDDAEAPVQHVAFTLTKRGIEQHAALGAAAAALHVPIHAISMRGNKDKCAVTRQRCVVAGATPRRVTAACEQLGRGGAVEMSDLGPAPGPLTIGHLGGNRCGAVCREAAWCWWLRAKVTTLPPHPPSSRARRFTVVLRNCTASSAEVAARVEALGQRGFVNFFGSQRVGLVTQEPQPWRIGAALLRGAWQEAVKLILTPNGRDSPAVDAAKAAFQAGEPLPEVRDMFPPSAVRERALVKVCVAPLVWGMGRCVCVCVAGWDIQRVCLLFLPSPSLLVAGLDSVRAR